MAHIPVVRRSMRPEEWTGLRFGWLKRHLYSDTEEIPGVEVRETRQISEGEYTYYDADFRSLKRGDLYFMPDGTAFLRAEAEVPARFEGKEVWLLLKTAAEMIVKVNGKYAGGLDPNRERMLLTLFLDGDRASIEITGYNRSKPDDGRRGELRLPRRAQLLNLLEDVQGEGGCISYRPFEILTLGFPFPSSAEGFPPEKMPIRKRRRSHADS